MSDPQSPQALVAPPPPRAGRVVTVLAVAASGALAVLLAIRPISSLDLGYHLAYGERLLDHGEIVDTNPYIYTVDGRPGHRAKDPGPGCWWDEHNRYRFPNANWLTQAGMAWVHRAGGANGLVALQVALVAGTFALAVLVMRRLRLPWPLVAGGMLLMCLGAYPRFSLRPELVSYLLLMAEMAILAGDRLRWPSAAALVGIHLAFVNLHSFWPIGLGLVGAMLAESALRLWWRRMRRTQVPRGGKPAPVPADDGLRGRVLILAVVLAGQAAATFANPWTWRIAVLPVQTLAYMHEHNVGTPPEPNSAVNSWARIGELFGTLTFTPGFASRKATAGYLVALALGGLAVPAGAIRRRWAWVLIVLGLFAASVGHRRNIAILPLLGLPVILGLLWAAVAPRAGKLSPRRGRRVAWGFSSAVLAGGAWFIVSVSTQQFYLGERLPSRLGAGWGRVVLPLGAAAWLNEHRPAGRLWTDFDTSSNLHYFTAGRWDVPVLTNTWAQPPGIMGDVMDCCEKPGGAEFVRLADQYDLRIAALSSSPRSGGLIRHLTADTHWALVHVGVAHVVFVRRDGPNAALARQELRPEEMDLARFRRTLRAMDPVPAYPLYLGGLTLLHVGWYDQAIEILQDVVKLDGDYAGAWVTLGMAYGNRGRGRLAQNDISRGRPDIEQAREHFRKALALDPDNPAARRNLDLADRQLRALDRVGGLLPFAPGPVRRP